MYAELEKFLAAHEHSERHAKVLDCLLECRNKPPVDRSKRNSIESGNRSGKAGSEEAVVDKVRVTTSLDRSDQFTYPISISTSISCPRRVLITQPFNYLSET